MKQFLKHIPIYIITVLVLFLSVGVNVVKCNESNRFCNLIKTKNCKQETSPCKKRIKQISCCKSDMPQTSETKNRSCGENTSIHIQFDFETTIAKIHVVEKCKEVLLFKLRNELLFDLISNKNGIKHLSFSSPPILNKPMLSETQVLRL